MLDVRTLVDMAPELRRTPLADVLSIVGMTPELRVTPLIDDDLLLLKTLMGQPNNPLYCEH